MQILKVIVLILIMQSNYFIPTVHLTATDGLISYSSLYGGNAMSGVDDCTQLKFISCDSILNLLPSGGDYKGTVVVMDDGLSVFDWFNIEDATNANGLYLDIVAFVVPDENGTPVVYGDYGVRGRNAYPSISQILDILKNSDGNTGWSQLYGWGYVDLLESYLDAVDLGISIGNAGSGGGGCGSNCGLL